MNTSNNERPAMRFASLSFFAAMLLIAPLGSIARAEDAPASQPSTAPAAGATIEASNTEALKAAVGKDVTVHGKVSGTFTPASGSVLLNNFVGATRLFSVAFLKANMDAVNKGFEGDDLAGAIKGKSINVTGKIKMYKDKPEIEVTKPEQIKVEEDNK